MGGATCPPQQSEGGRRKRYPSIAFGGGDGFRGAQLILQIDDKIGSVICPSGGLSTGVSSLISDFPKNISVPTYPKSHLELIPSSPQRGVSRSSRTRVGCGGRGSVGARRKRRAGLKACERSLSEQTNGAEADG